MANRQTRLILKNSDIVNRPYSGASVYAGEAIVNTADGIMLFSGVTTSSSEWTPSGPGGNANFFEVGSNLYDLKIRNQITKYQGVEGASLAGKFLSGTTSGFVLADISSISGVDSYVTGGTYNSSTDTITLTLNEGKPNVTITGVADNFTSGATLIGSTAYFDRNDQLSAYTLDLSSFSPTGDTYVTNFTYDNANEFTITRNNSQPDLTATINNVTGLTVNGTLSAVTLDGATILSGGTDLGTIISNSDTFLTAFTYDNANNLTIVRNDGTSFDVNVNTVTGMTNTGNLDLQGELANSTGNVVINDALDVTGTTTVWGDILPGVHLTYDLGANGQRWDELWVRKVRLGTTTTTLEDDGANFTMSGTNGNFIFRPSVDSVFHSDIDPDGDLTRDLGNVSSRWNEVHAASVFATGLTISNLGANRVVYTNGSGGLTTEAGFEYNAGTDTMTVGNMNTAGAGSAFIGTGGLIVGSGGSTSNPGTGDVVIHGNLTVFGAAITAATGELYVEDNNITLNYSPTGDTSSTSIGAGWTIQDGDGSGNDVKLDIRSMNGFTGLTAQEIPDITEYSGPNGYTNRSYVTQLNDIVIRSTDVTIPNGVRVLAEFDVLDGGTY
jgi:hypothetical protein